MVKFTRIQMIIMTIYKYIGSTCDALVKRFSSHKKQIVLFSINEVGFDRFRVEFIQDCPCQDLYQLRPREARWIRELATWNKRIEGRTRTENREDKVERIFVI